MRCISVKIMVISVRQKKCFLCQQVSQPFLKMRKILLHMRKYFLIMSNFYLVEILSEPNILIVTSKKILKMSNYVLILSIFFLITKIRNLQCNVNVMIVKKLHYFFFFFFSSVIIFSSSLNILT